MRRTATVSFLVACGLLAGASPASAAVVQIEEVGSGGLVGQELRLLAAPGEQNLHTARPASGGFEVSGTGSGPVSAGPGCADTSPSGGIERRVTCSGSNIIRSRFVLGDLADLLFATEMTVQVTAFGGAGRDQLRGGSRGDQLSGGADVDGLRGAAGSDRLTGGGGPDLIEAGSGNDRSVGGAGSDNITGDAGEDELFGSGGADRLDGSAGSDRIIGGSGNDSILSSIGAGILSRDGAADYVDCGAGVDRLLADRMDRIVGCERVSFEERRER